MHSTDKGALGLPKELFGWPPVPAPPGITCKHAADVLTRRRGSGMCRHSRLPLATTRRARPPGASRYTDILGRSKKRVTEVPVAESCKFRESCRSAGVSADYARLEVVRVVRPQWLRAVGTLYAAPRGRGGAAGGGRAGGREAAQLSPTALSSYERQRRGNWRCPVNPSSSTRRLK